MRLPYFKISIISFVMVFGLTTCYTQEHNAYLKTLHNEIITSKTDSIKINKLLALSTYYYEHDIDLDSMIITARKAVKLSQKNKLLIETCKSYGALGKAHLLKNSLDSAYYYSAASYEIAKELRKSDLEFSALIELSSYYLKDNDLVKAIGLGLQALKIAEQSNDKSKLALAYSKLSRIFMLHDDDLKYKYYLDKSFKIIEDDNTEIASSIKSDIYTLMVDYFEHQRFYNPENTTLKDSVRYYAEKGINYGKSTNNAEILAYLIGVKGKMYFIEDNFKEAKRYYNEALTYRDQIGKNTLFNLYNKVAYVHIVENKVQKALLYKDSILQNIFKEPNHYRRADRFNSAYFICKTLKKYDLALTYHEEMTKAFNKAKDEKQIEALNELEVKYESQKKDAEIITRQLENETLKNKAKTNYFILGIIGLLGIGSLGFLYFKKQNKILVSELNLAKTKASLHRSQLNPHFISNSINTIYPFLYDKSDPNKAAAYLSDLSHMIRSILDSTFDTSWTLQEELKFIEQYCKVQELKMDIPLSLNLKFDDSLKPILIPSLITQTFVENCFVHGFATQDTPASINIEITKMDSTLEIVITDNGKGSLQSKDIHHKSRSHQIVEQRIKNTYPKSKLPKDFLTYGIKNKTYQVKIKLPIMIS